MLQRNLSSLSEALRYPLAGAIKEPSINSLERRRYGERQGS